jgi:hypothetical protein
MFICTQNEFWRLLADGGGALLSAGRVRRVTVGQWCRLVQVLDKFAKTRAAFSQEAGSGAMEEAIVDIRRCDFSNLDLSGKVMSGVQLQVRRHA